MDVGFGSEAVLRIAELEPAIGHMVAHFYFGADRMLLNSKIRPPEGFAYYLPAGPSASAQFFFIAAIRST